jgi:hypothetical protein
MPEKSHLKEIQAKLDAWPVAKTAQEKLKLLIMMKVHIELLEKPLKEQRNRKRMAYNKKTRIIKKALKQFLTALDKIFAKHEELGDSAVRDKLYAAIQKNFILPDKDKSLPEQFGMFSEEADKLVQSAVGQFLQHPEVKAARRLLKNPEDRLNAFQDTDVKTAEESDVFEYFGFRSKPRA